MKKLSSVFASVLQNPYALLRRTALLPHPGSPSRSPRCSSRTERDEGEIVHDIVERAPSKWGVNSFTRASRARTPSVHRRPSPRRAGLRHRCNAVDTASVAANAAMPRSPYSLDGPRRRPLRCAEIRR